MGHLLGFFNPRNVGIIGMMALAFFMKSQNDLNFDDYDEDSIQEQKVSDQSSQNDSKNQGQPSRSPASAIQESLAITSGQESTLSKASSSTRENNYYEREDDKTERGDRDQYARSTMEPTRVANNSSANPFVHTQIPNDPSISNDSGTAPNNGFDNTDRGDFLGGGFSNRTPSTQEGPADTFNFNNIGNGNDPNPNSHSTSDVAPVCTADKASGTYTSEVDISLSCNQSAKIFYCVGTGGSCCDPSATPIEYTGTFSIGSVDDNYCLSFYGQSTQSLLTSDYQDLNLLVNSTLPSLITHFPKVQIQTTQLPLMAHTQSLDFGTPNYFLHQINTKEHDPSSLVWNCEDVLNNYSLLSGANATLLDFDVSALATTDQIDQQILLPSLQYGENFFTTILEDRDRLLTGCQQQKIVVEDFQIFSISASAPVASSNDGSFSGFVSYGHFQEIPNATQTGSGQSVKSTQVLEEGFLSMTH